MQPCKNFGLGHSLPPSYDFKENTLRCYKLQGEHHQHQHGNICGWSQNASFWGNSVHGLIEQVQLALTLWVPGELIPLLPCVLLSARPINIAGLKQRKLPSNAGLSAVRQYGCYKQPKLQHILLNTLAKTQFSYHVV